MKGSAITNHHPLKVVFRDPSCAGACGNTTTYCLRLAPPRCIIHRQTAIHVHPTTSQDICEACCTDSAKGTNLYTHHSQELTPVWMIRKPASQICAPSRTKMYLTKATRISSVTGHHTISSQNACSGFHAEEQTLLPLAACAIINFLGVKF